MLRPAYPILTERLALRPFRDDDLDAFHDIQRRPDVVRFLYWEPRSRAEAKEMLGRRKLEVAIEREGQGLHLAADLRSSERLIGHFSLFFLSLEHRQGEIGFVVHPDHHGHGYGIEGAREMLRLGFEELGLHRIIGRCDARNVASAGLMERLGMRREAHLLENEFVKGEWADELDYAMLDREWRALPTAAVQVQETAHTGSLTAGRGGAGVPSAEDHATDGECSTHQRQHRWYLFQTGAV